MRKAVFIDKDGTLVEDVPYNVDPRRLVVYPDAMPALRVLTEAGYLPVVISNQPGVALGYFEESALHGVRDALSNTMQAAGVGLAGFFYCPHHPEGNVPRYAVRCDCRKPASGLIRKAARELNVDLSRSWMIGDILNDVEAGNRAGCGTVLVDRGNETEWEDGEYRRPDFTVHDLHAAAERIVKATHDVTGSEAVRQC